jgi:hypothetical protein
LKICHSDGVRANQTGTTVNIQCALLIKGIGYESSRPCAFKLSKKRDKATITSVKSKYR